MGRKGGRLVVGVPARVLRKRARLGLSQKEIGDILGVSEGRIRRLEGDCLPELLRRYLGYLGYRVAFSPRRKGEFRGGGDGED